jgi:DNA-directed RNA polymerase subunit RPC12/RpoP
VGNDACPYCSDRLTLSGYNDLATTDPLLAAEWSHNNIRSVLEVRKNQSLNALWICSTCHGEYSARIDNREVGDDACPYCSDRLTLSGYNDLVTKDPLLAAEWSRNNNQTPNKVRKNQSLVALWICPTCNGEYSARIADREVGDDACLYCSDRKILPGLNSFKACHEDLMSEWLEAENNLLGIDPDMASDTDRRNVWWKCEVCGRKYTLSINDRLLKQKRGHSSCTYCNGRRIKLIHFV